MFGQEEAEYYDVDDFTCPDEYKGFFPHLISCDKYWACDDGVAELRTCGNGLAFLDTDEVRLISLKSEQHHCPLSSCSGVRAGAV